MADIRIKETDGGDQNGKKASDNLKFSKKRKYKRWSRKKKITVIATLIFLILGIFGYKAYQTLNKIFADNGINIPGLLGDVSQLKGESSGRVNILLLGIGDKGHAGETLSDTIMIASIDTKNKNVAIISVPRDLYVNIPGYGYSKINEAHALGEEKRKGGGPEKAKETTAQTFDTPIHYYARVDFSGFSKLIDAVGGVDVYVDEDLYDPYYPDGGAYYVKKGQKHMNGREALKYTRSRQTTSDFDRAKRQQKVMIALKDKLFAANTIFSPKKVLDVMNVLGDHVKTDFQLAELKRVFEITKNVDDNKIVRKVIDNKETGLLVPGNMGGASVLQPASGNFQELRDFVKNVFAEGYIKDENAQIKVINSSGISGLARRASDSLKKGGLNVINSETGDNLIQKSRIYDYSEGKKPYTAKYLEESFGVSVEKQSETKEGIDFEIYLSKNYSNN